MITSSYVKDNSKLQIRTFLSNAVRENRVLFYDKTKSQVINSILRISFPNDLDKLDFSKNLAQYSTIVKGINATYTKNSLKDTEGTALTAAQIDYFKDSQIRDDSGNLKVMYHGSGKQFTVFDKKKAKSSGYYGSGFYFTESESHAKQYGSNYKTYLNITKPMKEGTNDITKAQLKKFVAALNSMPKMVHRSTGIDEFRIIKSFSVGESEIEITEETYDNFKEKRNSTDVSTDGDGKRYNNVHNIGSQYRRESRQNNKVGKRTSKGNKNRHFDIYSKFSLTKTSEGKSLSPEVE